METERTKGTGREGVKRIALRLSRRVRVGVCAAAATSTLAACAVPNDMVPTYPSRDALTVAPSEVIGHEVLTDVYALALRREGVLVEIAEPSGTTTDATDKVLAGTSDFTIGYSGQLLDDVEGADSSASADSPMSATEVYEQLEDSLPDTVSVGHWNGGTAAKQRQKRGYDTPLPGAKWRIQGSADPRKVRTLGRVRRTQPLQPTSSSPPRPSSMSKKGKGHDSLPRFRPLCGVRPYSCFGVD